MYIALLVIHIAIALLTILATVAVIMLARSPRVARAIHAMWSSFMATLVSGLVLVVLSPKSLGHFCLIATVYVVGILAVHRYAHLQSKQNLQFESSAK